MDKSRPSTQSTALWLWICLFGFTVPVPAQTPSGGVTISHTDALRIGKKIWRNECGGSVAGLTSWNSGENFASLGIGHFIWYPKGVRGPFDESFPKLVEFAN